MTEEAMQQYQSQLQEMHKKLADLTQEQIETETKTNYYIKQISYLKNGIIAFVIILIYMVLISYKR